MISYFFDTLAFSYVLFTPAMPFHLFFKNVDIVILFIIAHDYIISACLNVLLHVTLPEDGHG